MAFWTDKSVDYPHILCGVIAEWYDDGKVHTLDYGVGCRIKPDVILPEFTGIEYKETLANLRAEYSIEKAKLKAKFMSKLSTVML